MIITGSIPCIFYAVNIVFYFFCPASDNEPVTLFGYNVFNNGFFCLKIVSECTHLVFPVSVFEYRQTCFISKGIYCAVCIGNTAVQIKFYRICG